MKKEFTQIPNKIIEIISNLNLSLLELKAVNLLLRIYYGCHIKKRYPIKINYSDFIAVGIKPSKIKKVLLKLENKKIIQIKYNVNKIMIGIYFKEQYLLNFDVETEPYYLRLRKVIGKNLPKRTNSKSNNKYAEWDSTYLPFKQYDNYQISKKLNHSESNFRPLFEAKPSSEKSMKDILKYKYKENKDNTSLSGMKDNISFVASDILSKLEPGSLKHIPRYKKFVKDVGPDRAYEFCSSINQDPSILNKGAVFYDKCKEFIKKHPECRQEYL